MKNKKIIIIIFLFAAMFSNSFAQNINKDGSVVISNVRIDSLLQLHIEYNNTHPTFQGYRIQILKISGNDALEIIEKSKFDFSKKYENIPVYLTYSEPDYRVRVGDFRTRLDAERFLKKINRKYPGAWVIQDDINFPDLPNYTKNKKL